MSGGLVFLVCVGGCVWFVWNAISRWYPALKERPGLPRVYAVLVGLNALAWLPGLVFARYWINIRTGVEAGNFTTALSVLTFAGMAYVWLILITLCLGLTILKSWLMVFCLIGWDTIRSVLWSLTLSVPPARPMPLGRYIRDGLGCLGVVWLLTIVTTNATVRRVVQSVASSVLVATEFSHDHTCTASSETRLVASLKDRKELKVSNILIADVTSWSDIQFSLGHCE